MSNEQAETPTLDPKRRRDAAAAYIVQRFGIPCSPKTLAKLACIGGGPAFYKAGRIPLYADQDLDDWAQGKLSKRITSTSEYTQSKQAAAVHAALS